MNTAHVGVLLFTTLSLLGCELLQDNEQRDVITVIQLESAGCSLYMEKHLATDNSALETSFAERDERFKIRGAPKQMPLD
jgi:hypothetical protein